MTGYSNSRKLKNHCLCFYEDDYVLIILTFINNFPLALVHDASQCAVCIIIKTIPGGVNSLREVGIENGKQLTTKKT